MKMRKRRKVINAATRYNNAWTWGVKRISNLIGESNRKMSMALYQVYSAVRNLAQQKTYALDLLDGRN